MRSKMLSKTTKALLTTAGLLVLAEPAMALTAVGSCDSALTSPTATACSGYYDGNLFGGNAAKIADQKAGVAALPSAFTFDGNWSGIDPAFKVTSLTGGNVIDFGQTLFGETIVGAHFGNVAGPAGNVSVFWQFDFGTAGATGVTLNDTQGFSNAVLYTTGAAGAVPEAATWAMLIMGVGVVGFGMRRKQASIRPALAI